MKTQKSQNLFLFVHLAILLAYLGWWIAIHFFDQPNPDNYTDTYSLVALSGSLFGFIIAKRWGMWKSRFGATIFYFSLGLLLQFFGQLIYALFYRLGDVELAFPSVGDVPYLLSNVAYIVAVYNLLKVLVVSGSVFRPRWVLGTSLVATALLGWFSYTSFLNLAVQDERGLMYQIVNVAYPLIQAFYFLIGLAALLQAKRMAGGRMLKPVALVLFALIVQYAADFNFLYQSYHETWEAAGVNDLIFVVGYGFMGVAILMIDRIRQQSLAQPVAPVEAEA